MLKKLFVVTIITAMMSLGVSLVGTLTTYAQTGNANPLQNVCSQPGAGASNICSNPSSGDNPIAGSKDSILAKAIRLVLIVAGVAAVIMIIVGGFQYVLSSGDSNRVNTAKNTIIYALVGLVVAVLAQVILSFVIKRV